MMPRLGEKYDIEIETISKPKEEYNTDEYFELDLPVAPAVMVGDEIVVEKSDVSEEIIRRKPCFFYNLVIHALVAILCLAAPFYQLRWSNWGENYVFEDRHTFPDKNSLLRCGINQKGGYK